MGPLGPWLPFSQQRRLVNWSEPTQRDYAHDRFASMFRYERRAIDQRPLPAYYKSVLQPPDVLAHPFSVMTLPEMASNEIWEPDDPSALCELALMDLNVCRGGNETNMACMVRIGFGALSEMLPSRCTRSEWFTAWHNALDPKERTMPTGGHVVWTRGPTFESQVAPLAAVPRPPLPVAQWPQNRFGKPVRCVGKDKEIRLVHPISYALPSANLAPSVTRRKLWDFVPFSPTQFPVFTGTRYPLKPDHEWLSDFMHRHSMYGFTHRRGGWDCLRHYEILGGGAVPYFVDLSMCPEDSATSLPKSLIVEAMQLAGVARIGLFTHLNQNIHTPYIYRRVPSKTNRRSTPLTFMRPGELQHDTFNFTRYFELADAIHDWTKRYLTAASLAAYVLNVTGAYPLTKVTPRGGRILVQPPRRVLVMLPQVYDYLAGNLVIGLYELGVPTTLVGPWHEVLYGVPCPNATTVRDCNMTRGDFEAYEAAHRGRIQGGGWMNGFRIPTAPPQPLLRYVDKDLAVVAAQLARKEFDAVIYVARDLSAPPTWPLWSAVEKALPNDRRFFVDVWDVRPMEENALIVEWAQYGILFKREMGPSTCIRATP